MCKKTIIYINNGLYLSHVNCEQLLGANELSLFRSLKQLDCSEPIARRSSSNLLLKSIINSIYSSQIGSL